MSSRRAQRENDALRHMIREAVGLTMLLEEWGVLHESDKTDPQVTAQGYPDATEIGLKVATGDEQDARAIVRKTLDDNEGAMGPSAEELDMSPKTLRRYTEKLGLADKVAKPGPRPKDGKGKRQGKGKGD